LVGLCSMFIVHVSSLVVNSLYSLFYPLYLCHTQTSDWSGSSPVTIVFELLRIAKALLTCCLVYNRRTSLVVAQIALALLAIVNNSRSISVILGYKPKTSNIKTILSGLAESLTVLTAIYKIISLLICSFLSSSFIILYIQRNSAWYRFISSTLL
jgi:hypothetical protein